MPSDPKVMNLADARNAVMRTAWEWWRSNRPAKWTPWEHAAHPKVNCHSIAAQTLAEAVAEYVKAGGSV